MPSSSPTAGAHAIAAATVAGAGHSRVDVPAARGEEDDTPAVSPACGEAASPACGEAVSPARGGAVSPARGGAVSPARGGAVSPARGGAVSPARGEPGGTAPRNGITVSSVT